MCSCVEHRLHVWICILMIFSRQRPHCGAGPGADQRRGGEQQQQHPVLGGHRHLQPRPRRARSDTVGFSYPKIMKDRKPRKQGVPDKMELGCATFFYDFDFSCRRQHGGVWRGGVPHCRAADTAGDLLQVQYSTIQYSTLQHSTNDLLQGLSAEADLHLQ